MPSPTPCNEDLAAKVRSVSSELNRAMQAAADAGLLVKLIAHEANTLNGASRPVITVTVLQEL